MKDALTAISNNRPVAPSQASMAAVELLGRSPAVEVVQELVRRAASRDGGVLLVAEAGVCVESVARELHLRSRAPGAPFILVDCGAADRAPLDAVLFGAAPLPAPRDLEWTSSGSHLAAARGGTLFLDGVADLPGALQARLARVVRDGEVRLDGEAVSSDIRVISSALPTIDADVRDHRFRPDLYRGLAAIRIDLPPLRKRREDVPALAERVLLDACAASSLAPRSFTNAALALLAALGWPGNLAELRGFVERIVAATSEGLIQIEQIVPALQLRGAVTPFVPAGTLREARLRFEREYIAAVLQHHRWKIADAARTLGIQRPNLYRKARQLGLPVMRSAD
jgi:DNA-binding NtrC family response regulator